jgi:hypothetical protein
MVFEGMGLDKIAEKRQGLRGAGRECCPLQYLGARLKMKVQVGAGERG